LKVLIAGGGVAGLEAALTLRELAPEQAEVTMLAPDETFEIRALSVRDAFGRAQAPRHALSDLAKDAGFTLTPGKLASVDPAAKTVRDSDGNEHAYDALLVAIGARPEPALPHAATFAGPQDAEAMHGVLEDLESGYAKRIAFVAPPHATWPLPVYELALMTAERAASLGIDDVSIAVVTPEDAPLQIFGEQASAALASLLAERNIAVMNSTAVEPTARVPELDLGAARGGLKVDRVVALPALHGPRIEGLPADDEGFLPIDEHGRVEGVEHVWAAGDGTNYAVKQGGIAAQQADVAAEAIAAAAGADVDPKPFRPVLRGILLTGDGQKWMRKAVEGSETPDAGETVAEHALWWPPTKVAGHRLAPFLWEREEEGVAPTPPSDSGVEVDHPLHPPTHAPRRRVVLSDQGSEGHLELLQLD